MDTKKSRDVIRYLITSDVFWCAILAFLLFILVVRGFTLPFYWDTAAFLIPAAKSIAETGNLFSYVQGTDYPHFFLLPWFISLFISTPLYVQTIHIIGYFFSAFFLFVMYYLGKTIANRTVGIALSLVFLANPLFLAQTNLVYFEIIGTTLRYLAIVFLIKRRYGLFLLTTLFAFVREYNALVLFMVGFVYLLINRSIYQKTLWFIKYLMPILIATGLWLIIHYQAAGWWLYSPQRSYEENHLGTLSQGLEYMLFAQGRWILLVGLLAALSITFFKVIIKRKFPLVRFSETQLLLILLIISAVATLGRITVLGYLLQRHIFPTLPAYYLLTILFLYYIFSRVRIAFWIAVLAIIYVQFQYRFDCQAWNLEDCITVFQLLDSKKQAIQYLGNVAKLKTIGISNVENYEFDPLTGYANESLTVINHPFTEAPDYLYITPVSSEQLTELSGSENYDIIRSWLLQSPDYKISIFERKTDL